MPPTPGCGLFSRRRTLSVEQLEPRRLFTHGYADAVLEFERGAWVDLDHSNPTACLGNEPGGVSIGRNGFLILAFLDEMAVDGPGPDLLFVDAGGAASSRS